MRSSFCACLLVDMEMINQVLFTSDWQAKKKRNGFQLRYGVWRVWLYPKRKCFWILCMLRSLELHKLLISKVIFSRHIALLVQTVYCDVTIQNFQFNFLFGWKIFLCKNFFCCRADIFPDSKPCKHLFFPRLTDFFTPNWYGISCEFSKQTVYWIDFYIWNF